MEQRLLDSLSLVDSQQASHWRGIPLFLLSTPEGRFAHRFTPDHVAVSLLMEGTIGTHVSMRGRGADVDWTAGSMTIFPHDSEIVVRQAGSANAKRIVIELDMARLCELGLSDDELVAAPLRPSLHFRDPELAALMRMMALEMAQGSVHGALYAESMSVGVAMHLCRTRSVHPPWGTAERGRLSTAQLARIDELIGTDLASDLSLSTLASAVGLSKPQFIRVFRNTTGLTPHRYVVRIRAGKARELIESSGMPLRDVALQVGFCSQSHLNRVFLDTYKLTPGEARAQRRSPVK